MMSGCKKCIQSFKEPYEPQPSRRWHQQKKTGEIIPERSVLQVETTDNRGLVKMDTITVPSLDGYTGKSARS